MPRAIWKGAISFGLVHIPIELYPAQSSQSLNLDMLDRRDFSPIGYKRYNKTTGKEIQMENIVKGFEYEKGQYVVLTQEDLRKANVESTQRIDIQAFVEASDISPIYFDQPYFLAPLKGGEKVYVLLRETLKRANKVGIAQVVIRTKQHLAALLPGEDAIILNLLRYQDEIRSTSELKLPDANDKNFKVSDKEIKMALSLLEDMTDKWDPSQYHDTYREDVMKMVDKKIRARQTKRITEPSGESQGKSPSSNVVDLMELLKQSIGTKTKAVKPAATSRTRKTPRSRTPAKKTA